MIRKAKKCRFVWGALILLSMSGCHSENPLLKDPQKTKAFLTSTELPLKYPSYGNCYFALKGKFDTLFPPKMLAKLKNDCIQEANLLYQKAKNKQLFPQASPEDFADPKVFGLVLPETMKESV